MNLILLRVAIFLVALPAIALVAQPVGENEALALDVICCRVKG